MSSNLTYNRELLVLQLWIEYRDHEPSLLKIPRDVILWYVQRRSFYAFAPHLRYENNKG